MPYYAWRGVNIFGDYRKGKMYARTPELLDSLLFKREIALISCRSVTWRWQYRPVCARLKIEFFKQLATLLASGVSLPESLLIVAEQLFHPGMQEIIHELANTVDHGNALSFALFKYERIFDPLTVQLIKAGEESGALAEALQQVADRLEMREEFASAVRAAVVLPAMTFAFFVSIAFFLFVFIVPKFAELFLSMNKELPALTHYMLSISAFLVSKWALMGIGCLIFLCYSLWQYGETEQGSQLKNRIVMSVPMLRTILWYRFIAYFTASIALLLERGMQLVPALHIVAQSIDNKILKEYVLTIEHEVSKGRSFSAALQDVGDGKFPIELVAIVHVGENSAVLDVLLKKASIRYQDLVKRLLKRFSSFVQPALMIILGLLVLMLIFAIYVPIMQLSHVV